MSAADAKTAHRMPWRLAVLVPVATFVIIWRGVPFVTPMLAFSWIVALLAGGGLVVVGLYGPQALDAMSRASKEHASRRRLKVAKDMAKAQAKAAKVAAKKK
ncbi:hypothetical protein [Streptomyces sp. NPDC013489]|uniref:hypothetical protein n=1 Tax=Streptomyces sp. NPDC013489 TaxID=3155606 RepID=UPI0033D28815